MKRRSLTHLPATLPTWLQWSAWESVRPNPDVSDRVMSENDVKRNIAESVDGDDVSGLRDALRAYRENKEIEWRRA